MQRSFAFLLVLAFVTFTSAAHIAISVGKNGLTYTPAQAKVRVGDKVTWTFADTVAHTVTQSTAKGGCKRLAGGFASTTRSNGTFSWVVKGAGPWYYHCAVRGHCAAGMVGSLTLAK
ncbi:Cupredoxin [Jimgerdemannia flammicorona]|uniref:Cupredoxin n=1 Tax=Jimgerdemannia flammicorona TaxID=994334 RepID=A0A433Q617_9FUNG|nr:Cupredoxin [Jimgerdemannia flammicorona]